MLRSPSSTPRPAAAGPTSVSAARWGFGDPARFALYYRTAYGVAPTVTFRSSG